MTRRPHSEWSNEDLIARFLAITLEQDDAISKDKNQKYNRLFKEMVLVLDELKMRPDNPRRALLALLDHPNAQVRLKAAIHTLAVDRDRAIAVLQAIKNSKEYPQAADAWGILDSMAEGRYTPS
jgi:hypothetical protein